MSGSRLSYRLRLAWERRKLALSEWWFAFRCDRLHRCPGCNVCMGIEHFDRLDFDRRMP